MSTTTTILNADCVIPMASVDTQALDVTKFALIDQTVSPDGNTREAVYQMIEGTEEYPLSIRIGSYKTPKANGNIGGSNTSIKLTTYAQKADADDVLWTLPMTVTLAVSAPGGNPMPDPVNLIGLLDAVLTAYVPFVAGNQSQVITDELKFAIVNRALTHGSTAS